MRLRPKPGIGCAWALALCLWSGAGRAEDLGIYERVLEASGSFAETAAALEAAIKGSAFELQGVRDLSYADKAQEARIYVLTSPAFREAAAGEAPNTVSAQVLRIGLYQYGPGKATQIDIANPVAHAIVYYAESPNYEKLVATARSVEQGLRELVAKVPGKAVQVPLAPIRSESALRSFDGDGPAVMMAKWRNWSQSQREIESGPPETFAATVERVEKALRASRDTGIEDPSGWILVSKIAFGSNAVHFGISNPYTENKCIRINSDFRSNGKAADAPFPGVDHAPALPLEVLVYNDGTKTRVVQYGEMWRMQLYFWDSGYLAFAKNTLIPDVIFDSIAQRLAPPPGAGSAAGKAD
jgi:hypothetical protein